MDLETPQFDIFLEIVTTTAEAPPTTFPDFDPPYHLFWPPLPLDLTPYNFGRGVPPYQKIRK